MTTNVLAFAPAHGTSDRMSHSDLDRVIADHRKPLMRYVLRLTFGDQHLAEDIVQETFLRVWQRPSTITTHHKSLRPWLFTVASNLVCDHKRRRQARPTEIYGEIDVDKPATTDHMANTLATHDMSTALNRLSPEHRTVLTYVYYRGKSLAETATTLNLPLGTVKSRVYYALRALRVAIDDLGLAPEPAPAGENTDLARAS